MYLDFITVSNLYVSTSVLIKKLSLKLSQISVKQTSFLCLIQLIDKSHLSQCNEEYNALFEGDSKTTIQIFEKYNLKIIG